MREGIAGEDWVITRGLQRARPGLKVEPKRMAIAATEAGAAKGADAKSE